MRAGQRREVSVGKMQKSVYVCVCFYMSIEKECYAAGNHLIVGIQRNNTVGRKVKLFLNTALWGMIWLQNMNNLCCLC